MTTLVLASQSPRRENLLKAAGERFESAPSYIEEIRKRGESPENYVKRLSLEKALACPWRGEEGSQWIVLAADTTVVLEERGRKKILEKPQSKSEAIRMLTRLSGNRHLVFTAYTLVAFDSGKVKSKKITRVVRTEVEFRKLSKGEIVDYVNSGEPMDKAGAYGAQSGASQGFISKIKGSYSSVVGLPLAEVIVDLRRFRDAI